MIWYDIDLIWWNDINWYDLKLLNKCKLYDNYRRRTENKKLGVKMWGNKYGEIKNNSYDNKKILSM